jgi:hypothetical protein
VFFVLKKCIEGLERSKIKSQYKYEYNMQTQIQPGQIWQHYKGNNYRIIAISCHSEDLTWYVVYETLYDNQVSKIWHRPLEMFLETIEIDGITMPRFKHIE